MMIISPPRTGQEIEVHHEAPCTSTWPSSPSDTLSPRLSHRSDFGHRSFRTEAEGRAYLAPPPTWDEVRDAWEQRLPLLPPKPARSL